MAEIKKVQVREAEIKKASAKATQPKADSAKDVRVFGNLTTSGKVKPKSDAEDKKVKNNISAFGSLTTSSKESLSKSSSSVSASRLVSAQSKAPIFGTSMADVSGTETKELTYKELTDAQIEEMQNNKREFGTASFGIATTEAEAVAKDNAATLKATSEAMQQENAQKGRLDISDGMGFGAFEDSAPNSEAVGSKSKQVISSGVMQSYGRYASGHAGSSLYRQVHKDFGMVDRVSKWADQWRWRNQCMGDMMYPTYSTGGCCSGGSKKKSKTWAWALAAGIGGIAVGALGFWGLSKMFGSSDTEAAKSSGGGSNGGGARTVGGGAGNAARTGASSSTGGAQKVSSEAANNMNSAASNISTDPKTVTAKMVDDGTAALSQGSAKLNEDSASLAEAEGRKAGYAHTLDENKAYVEELKKQEGGVEEETTKLEGEKTTKKNELDNAQKVYDGALNEQTESAEAFEEAGKKRDTQKGNVEKYTGELNTANGQVKSAQAKVDKLKTGPANESQDAKTKREAALSQAESDLQAAQDKAKTTKENLDSAKKALEKAEQEYQAAKERKENAEKALEKSNDTKETVAESLEKAREAHDKAVKELECHKARVDEANNIFFESNDKLKEAEEQVTQMTATVEQGKAAQTTLENKVAQASDALEEKYDASNEGVQDLIGQAKTDDNGNITGFLGGKADNALNAYNNLVNNSQPAVNQKGQNEKINSGNSNSQINNSQTTDFKEVTVKSGDSLWRIAQNEGVNVNWTVLEQIAKANGLEIGEDGRCNIQEGQRIKIPLDLISKK